MDNPYPLSHVISVDDVPPRGKIIEFTATAEECRVLAVIYGILSIQNLKARFEVRPGPDDGLKVHGRVEADVTQSCVVSLEPVPGRVSEEIELLFSPSVEEPNEESPDEDLYDMEASERPEPLINGRVDLGEIAAEFVALGLDPYPRKPGVVFQPPAEAGDEKTHPFAALAALKSGKNEE